MRWPTSNLLVCCRLSDAHRAIYLRALAAIEAACAMRFATTDQPVVAGPIANIVAGYGYLDGPGNEVALSQEPFEGMTAQTQLVQTFELVDLAALDDNGVFICFLHELGHCLGRGHESWGVMQPVLDTTLTGLTVEDVGVLQELYGPPPAAPAAGPDTPPAASSGGIAIAPVASPPAQEAVAGVVTNTYTLPDGTQFDVTVSVWNFRKPAG